MLVQHADDLLFAVPSPSSRSLPAVPSTAHGKWSGIRVLSVIDTRTRESWRRGGYQLCQSAGHARIGRNASSWSGTAQSILCDNGPQPASDHFPGLVHLARIALLHIRPGRPMQNGYVENFTGKFRDQASGVTRNRPCRITRKGLPHFCWMLCIEHVLIEMFYADTANGRLPRALAAVS